VLGWRVEPVVLAAASWDSNGSSGVPSRWGKDLKASHQRWSQIQRDNQQYLPPPGLSCGSALRCKESEVAGCTRWAASLSLTPTAWQRHMMNAGMKCLRGYQRDPEATKWHNPALMNTALQSQLTHCLLMQLMCSCHLYCNNCINKTDQQRTILVATQFIKAFTRCLPPHATTATWLTENEFDIE
jgi:hypothetical protein